MGVRTRGKYICLALARMDNRSERDLKLGTVKIRLTTLRILTSSAPVTEKIRWD